MIDQPPLIVAESTAYSYCSAGSTMADGTPVRPGSVATLPDGLALGTKITVLGRGPDGRRRYTVRDRIGHSSELDFWVASCAVANAWGRRTVRYRLGWPELVKLDRWRQVAARFRWRPVR